jgi:aspartate racemase
LFVTRFTMQGSFYPDVFTKRGIDLVLPNEQEQDYLHDKYMHELVHGVFEPEAVACFQRVIERMKSQGCDAVILGCTEIPLIMNDSNASLPTLDSTRLLARAALRRAALLER